MSLTVAVVVFSAVALLPLPEVYAQTFCYGGLLPCVQNAVCNATTDVCECDAGFFGNGRIVCRASTRCTCSALADPNLFLFDTQDSQQKVKANLACSFKLVDSNFLGPPPPPTCAIREILAHPEIRGTGSAANLRVFVNELDVKLLLPAVTFTINSTGTTVTSGSAAEVVSGTNADGFQIATVQNCFNLQVGYNGTYAGAYIDTVSSAYTADGLCGNCDNTADEAVGSTNVTSFAYFLKFIVAAADQKGPFAAECGSIESTINALCDDAELALAADVCLPYVSRFGTCLIDDASEPLVTDFNSVLTTKFIPCLANICATGNVAAQCAALTASETATCTVSPFPASCP